VGADTFEFKSEAQQLLNLMIHSLYSTRDIFLRELISNASDALDKRRFAALTDPSLEAGEDELKIQLKADEERRTLTLSDAGIGMSRDELIENLGTIARSGTKAFMESAREAESAEGGTLDQLIGQFGVGFYSAFIVAEKVDVVSRKAGSDEAWCWSSTGDGSFSVEETTRQAIGTTITMHLRDHDAEDGLEDFTQEWPIRSTVKRYSDFVQYPIELFVSRTEPKRDDEGEVIEGESETTESWETINSRKAIWAKDPSDVTDEEYDEFYKHISRDWKEPFERVRIKAEGLFDYTALVFIPSERPFDLFDRDQKHGLQLYANRVLIKERADELLPEWLRFVRGVVESPDLTLNVSREMLQQDKRVRSIRKQVVKRVTDALKKLLGDERERYLEFWTKFGRVLKEGVADRDFADRLKPLFLFESSHEDGLTTLDEYIERMDESQEEIYYLVADSRGVAERSPHLEAFKAKGVEVLFLTEEIIDEWLAMNLGQYEEKKFRSIGEGEVELGTEEEKAAAEEERNEKSEVYKPLMSFLQEKLDSHLKEVRLSSRLTSSPAVLVQDEGAMGPMMRRMLEQSGQAVPEQKRILELNPDHEIIGKMQSIHAGNPEEELLAHYAEILLGQALILEGDVPPDPGVFGDALTALMTAGHAG